MKLRLEEVFKTEGIPEYTFVAPPNYNEILVDLRSPRKPVVVEGQSGTGKTTTVKKILGMDATVARYSYLSARKPSDTETYRSFV
jgi:Cdc6-like AAA superfamily ATPase